jgi:hypothetical protein
MKKTLLFALTIAIFGCGASEQEQKTKDSLNKFLEVQAIDKSIDSVRLYGKEMEIFYDYKISLVNSGRYTEKELEKYTTYKQMDSLMKSITDKIVEDLKK